LSKTATPSGGRRNLAAFLRFKGRVAELAAEVGWSSGRLSISEGGKVDVLIHE